MNKVASFLVSLGLSCAAGGLHGEVSQRLLQEDLATALVRQTLAAVITAHETDNFSVLHAMGSADFSEKISVNQLSQTINELLSDDINLLPALLPEPEFAEPIAITDDNQIAIAGYIPTVPMQTNFTFNYVWEAASWRISNLSFSLTPADVAIATELVPPQSPPMPDVPSDWQRRGIPRPSVSW